MKVILKENISKLGEIGEIVEVREGYFNNYLFPRNKAVCATKKKIEEVERNLDFLREKHNKKFCNKVN